MFIILVFISLTESEKPKKLIKKYEKQFQLFYLDEFDEIG
jgi:hypothetical protein